MAKLQVSIEGKVADFASSKVPGKQARQVAANGEQVRGKWETNGRQVGDKWETSGRQVDDKG